MKHRVELNSRVIIQTEEKMTVEEGARLALEIEQFLNKEHGLIEKWDQKIGLRFHFYSEG